MDATRRPHQPWSAGSARRCLDSDRRSFDTVDDTLSFGRQCALAQHKGRNAFAVAEAQWYRAPRRRPYPAGGYRTAGRSAAAAPQLQPKSSEFGILDKLFADPDRAAKAVLAANPNTALYDIAKRVVYLPDGDKLEAHSGYGQWIDDPDSVHRKDVGVTPPNVYAVSFREKPFHGVRALRMKPVGSGNMYGRDGILVHSYLLGDGGASNGCISVRDYDKFLKAYEDGKFNQIIVLRSADEPAPSQVASAQAQGT